MQKIYLVSTRPMPMYNVTGAKKINRSEKTISYDKLLEELQAEADKCVKWREYKEVSTLSMY